jgi:macrolide-specific efflux system membrane fusion protein
MRRTRRQWWINAGLVVVLAAVAGVGLLLASGRSASGTEASTVRTVAVRTGDVTSSVTADGSVEAVNEVAANFETSGTIERLPVKVGDSVTKGEVIATLEKADARRAVKVARLQLSAAQDQLDSAEEGTTTTDPQTGKSTTTVSSSQVASAEAQVVQAQASLDDAEAALEATTLRAPISGTVLQVDGKVGSSSGASSSQSGATAATSSSGDLVLIANLKTLQVSVSVPESDIGSLKVGQKATVTFPAVADAEANGTITSIDPVATTSNSVVTYGVVVRLSGVPSTVRLGQSASVTVTTDSATDVLVVPSTAVTTTGDRSTVTVLADGVQTPTVVQLGVVGDTWTQVESGVSSGDQVVLATSTSSSSTDSGFPGGGFGGLTGGPPAGAPAGAAPGGRS